jgi:hypothetical protein
MFPLAHSLHALHTLWQLLFECLLAAHSQVNAHYIFIILSFLSFPHPACLIGIAATAVQLLLLPAAPSRSWRE